jgi:putative sterol carrier protein
MRLTRSRIENLDGLKGTARLELTGNAGFRVDTHFGNDPLPDEPHCIIRMNDDVYRDLRTGSIPAQEAFITGKIAIEGDMQMAMELALAALSPD